MVHEHGHHAPRALAADPGWSLLRLSALERLGIAAVLIAALWAAVLAVIL